MDLNLNLENFEDIDAEGSRYVLTSPRSLEACSQLHIRPVHLLHKSLEDFIDENPGKPIELCEAFYTTHESERLELLEKCKATRRTLIMQSELEARKNRNEKKLQNGRSNSHFNPNTTRSKSMSKLSSPQAQKVTKSLSYDINNNVGNDELYEVIPYATTVQKSNKKYEISLKTGLSTPIKKSNDNPIKSVSSPRFSVHKTTKPSYNKNKNVEEPYMISTPKGVPSSVKSEHKYATVDKNWKTRKFNGVKDDNLSITISGERPSRQEALKRHHARKRSKSVDVSERNAVRPSDQLSVYSSLSLSKMSKNGFTTPQMQKDQKVVEVMREKRRQESREIKQRQKKMMEWEAERKKELERKTSQEVNKQKALANSYHEWEKNLKVREEKKRKEEMKMNLEREKQQNELEMRIKEKKDFQEKLRQEWIENKKHNYLQRKKQQESSKKSVEKEIESFQEITQQELEERFRKAERIKLEKEMKELNNIQMMNKRERERCNEIQRELARQARIEDKQKKKYFSQKMQRSSILIQKQLSDRDKTLKKKSKELDEKTHQTRKNKEEFEQQTENYLQSLALQKEEKIQIANTTAEKIVSKKAKKAQKLREIYQREQEHKLRELHRIEEEEIAKMKGELQVKDNRTENHIKIKEMAIQLSRANARASEAARNEVRKKDQTFLAAMTNAQLNAEIGRGLRSSLANQSSVKLG